MVLTVWSLCCVYFTVNGLYIGPVQSQTLGKLQQEDEKMLKHFGSTTLGCSVLMGPDLTSTDILKI